jgi:ubiquinone/menaquinone biosynthesis C-methylase UbiE
MKFIQYYFPNLYELTLKLLHESNIKKRYEYISKNIEKNSNVLDIGCGTGILGKFISKKCNYVGIDLNKKFLKFASKRGLKVFNCNAFNFKKYSRNIDTIVICDVLHHIYPRHEILLEKIGKTAKKVIICEPYSYKEKHKENFLEKSKIILEKMFDADGINPSILKFEKSWRYSKNELKDFFKDSIKNRKKIILKEIGKDIIAIYDI